MERRIGVPALLLVTRREEGQGWSLQGRIRHEVAAATAAMAFVLFAFLPLTNVPSLSYSYLSIQIAAFNVDKETQEHNQSQPSDLEIAANGGLCFKPGSAIEPMIPPVRDFNHLTLCLLDK